MELSEVKKGMKVRVVSNPEESIHLYGGSTQKREMAGNVFSIKNIRQQRAGKVIMLRFQKFYWSFVPDDLILVKNSKPIESTESVLFDPKSLMEIE